MEKGFYIICDLAIPYDEYAVEPKHFKIRLSNCEFIPSSIFLLNKSENIQSPDFNLGNGRFIFRFKNKTRDDNKAQKISDALLANIELIYQTAVVPSGYSPLAYWLENKIISDRYFLKLEQLKKNNSDLFFRLNHSAFLPRSVVRYAWKILPITLQQPFFDAVHFYQASIREYCFVGDSIQEVLDGYLISPVSRYDFVRAENAVINAYKAIEAIIGEPPKNEMKFRQKFEELGINPDMRVGFTGFNGSNELEPLIKKIRKFSYLRDKKAAHGRSIIDRHIKYFEIMDLQACAQAFIENAINNFRKNKMKT